MRGAKLGQRQRRFALQTDRVAARAPDDTRREFEQASALQNFFSLLRRYLDDVAALVFAEPDGVRWELAFIRVEFDAEARTLA